MSCFHFTLRRRRLLADLHTPVHVYLNVRDLYTQSVLMESTDAQSRENSRSFIAFDPLASVAVSRGDVTLKFPDGSRRSGRIDADHSLADTLTGFLRAFHVEGDPAEGCGLYGYTSFDAVRYLEPIDVRSVDAGPYDAPDVCYVLFRYVVVFHPFDHSLDLIELLADGEESHLDDVARAIARPDVALYRFRPVGPTHSPLTDDDHRRDGHAEDDAVVLSFMAFQPVVIQPPLFARFHRTVAGEGSVHRKVLIPRARHGFDHILPRAFDEFPGHKPAVAEIQCKSHIRKTPLTNDITFGTSSTFLRNGPL